MTEDDLKHQAPRTLSEQDALDSIDTLKSSVTEQSHSKEGFATFSSGAVREKGASVKYDLVPIEMVLATAEGLDYGAYKYVPRNWEKGLPLTDICRSLINHVWALMQGEDIDKASGQPHINLICCNAAFLAALTRRGTIIDDRR
jgi:hypothetical protein